MNPNIQTGLQPYGSYDAGQFDQVNLHNGALTLRIPLFSYPQRGDLRGTVVLMLGSKSWHNWEYACFSAPTNQAGCKGKWHMGPQSQLGVPPQGRTLGVYLAIDDGMAQLMSEVRYHYQGSAPSIHAINDSPDQDNTFDPTTTPGGGGGGSPAGMLGTSGSPSPVGSGPALTSTSAASSGSRTQWLLHEVYFPDGGMQYLWPSTSTAEETMDGSSIVCLGCIADPATNAPHSVLMRDGSRAVYTSTSWYYEDRNGNLVTPAADTMQRALYSGLNGVATTDLTGCSSTEMSATIYSFPAPGKTSSDASRLIKFCSHLETLNTAFSPDPNNPLTFEDELGQTDLLQESGAGTLSLVSKVIIYDGNSWTTSPTYSFEYNGGQTGSNSSGGTIVDYGDLTKVTLPTGGTVSYAWATQTPCENGLLTPVSRAIVTRTVDPTQVQIYSYSTSDMGATVIDKEGNRVTHTFTYPLPPYSACSSSDVETATQWFDSNGVQKKRVDSEYSAQQGPADLQYMPIDVKKTAETVTLDDGTRLRVETDYDESIPIQPYWNVSSGEIIQRREFAVNQTTTGTVTRCTSNSYLSGTAPSYAMLNERDLVSSRSVFAGRCSGTPTSQTA